MSAAMVYTTFTKEIEDYLQAKLPDLPPLVAQEIGAHIGAKIMILVSDMLREYDRDIKWQISKGSTLRRHGKLKSEE